MLTVPLLKIVQYTVDNKLRLLAIESGIQGRIYGVFGGGFADFGHGALKSGFGFKGKFICDRPGY